MTEPTPLYLLNAALERLAGPFRVDHAVGDDELLVVDQVAPRFGVTDPQILLGLAFALGAQADGHVGADLGLAARRHARARADRAALGAEPLPPDPVFPDAAAWVEAVAGSPLVGGPDDADRPFTAQHGAGEEGRPLIMSRQMWALQARIVAALDRLCGHPPEPAIAPTTATTLLAALFDGGGHARDAVQIAAERSVTVITGGPGTGKTYSIKRLLGLLLQARRRAEGAPLEIVLAAPTGKAAVRMTEAMAEELDALKGVDPEVKDALCALPAYTLHKLLRVRPDGTSGVTAESPLTADVVVVDEASMVDLRLMALLLEAVRPGARLILLGDRDQLASVEAGTVLADMVWGAFAGEPQSGPLEGAVIRFSESFRFNDAPTIATLAERIQRATDDSLTAAVGLLTGDERVETTTRVWHLEPDRSVAELTAALAAPYLDHQPQFGLRAYVATLAECVQRDGARALRDPEVRAQLLDELLYYRLLAVHRRGRWGVSGLNRRIGALLRARLDEAWQSVGSSKRKLPTGAGLWLGQPILVTENAYDVNLRNGDVALVLPSAESGRLCAVFPDAAERVREVPLERLPPHMDALAMTVHKSQGSQFGHVGLARAHPSSRIQTRELVYTAITRARTCLTWLGTRDALERALARPVARASGLAPLLWSAKT